MSQPGGGFSVGLSGELPNVFSFSDLRTSLGLGNDGRLRRGRLIGVICLRVAGSGPRP
jgi:hypothetical protein